VPDQALVDIHTHILPGWDNGLPSLEDAVAMAEAAARQGVRAIIGTPRMRDREDAFDKAVAVRESAWWLQDALDEAGIPITVFPGAQVMLGRYLPDAVRRRAPVTLAGSGKYILVDLPPGKLETYLGLIEALTRAGTIPVLAHPETHPALQHEPRALRRLVDRGALVQVNSGSLLARNGSGEREAARAFLGLGLVHFIATDTHPTNGKPTSLLRAAQAAAEIVGGEQAWRLVAQNPDRVLRGEPLETGPGAPDALLSSRA